MVELKALGLHPGVLFLGGLVVILLGAELLLRAASRLASMLRVSPLLIGLTVVSVGTSTPELAVGLTAAHEGKGALAVGNIAGTNIVNILLILGLSAMLRPLPTRALSVKLDVPVMVAAALALFLMALDGQLQRSEGALMVLAALAYTVVLVQLNRQETAPVRAAFAHEFGAQALGEPARGGKARQVAQDMGLLVAGMALTVLGAELLVAGAVAMAKVYGVSDAFIGLTIVAIGTSAPELVTTLLATVKNDRDVAIGNLIGSSVYNILVILGLTVVASPAGIAVGDDLLWFDLPVAIAVALVCLPVFHSGRQVSRTEGMAFVLAYLAYLGSLLWLRT